MKVVEVVRKDMTIIVLEDDDVDFVLIEDYLIEVYDCENSKM